MVSYIDLNSPVDSMLVNKLAFQLLYRTRISALDLYFPEVDRAGVSKCLVDMAKVVAGVKATSLEYCEETHVRVQQ